MAIRMELHLFVLKSESWPIGQIYMALQLPMPIQMRGG
jgi:hypothetical protein